jgi:hypothetical protein
VDRGLHGIILAVGKEAGYIFVIVKRLKRGSLENADCSQAAILKHRSHEVNPINLRVGTNAEGAPITAQLQVHVPLGVACFEFNCSVGLGDILGRKK